jgi:predicted phage replisome organizer
VYERRPFLLEKYLNKKRYWLKIKENYFDEDEIMFLKSQKNGYEYIYLWMRLLLKCLKVDDEKDCGILRVNEKIPYDETMIATLFGMNVDVVRVGIKIFQEMGMLEIQENGTFYIEAVQKMIGKESESAERVRLCRERKLLLCNTDVTDCNSNTNTNINKEEEQEKYYYVFEKWNTKNNLINHSIDTFNLNFKKRHKDILDTIGQSNYELAVDNYSEILSNPEKYYFKHKWTIWDFIARGVYNFVPGSDPLKNYLRDKNKSEQQEITLPKTPIKRNGKFVDETENL